jgi:outer membrane protein assembly factor BamD (BamD/ComL family)
VLKVILTRLRRHDYTQQKSRLEMKCLQTADRFLELNPFHAKMEMARYIKTASSKEEVRPILLLRAKASSLLAEQRTRH